MRAVLAALAAVPVFALAQAEEVVVAGDVIQTGPDASETYVVQRGDTLWDLSARYYADPFAWPKIWSANPQITNPHWIYPGQTIRFGPNGPEIPGLVAAPEAEEDGAGEIVAPQELADFSRGRIDRIELGEEDDVRVSGPHRIGWTAPKGLLSRHDSFVTALELDHAGTITAAFEDKLLLTLGDRAYAKFNPDVAPKAGQTFLLFETAGEIVHPATKKLFGYRTRILGKARVAAVDERAVTLDITEAYEAIERGARIAPAGEEVVSAVAARPNAKAVDGVIVATQSGIAREAAEHHVVYVDRGSADGVERGNVFTVLRSGDPYGRDAMAVTSDAGLPDEEIGALLVIDVKETASTTLVVRSRREMLIGDRAVLRPAASPASASLR